MRNDYSSEGIIKAMETLAEATKPYQAAMEVLKHNTEMFAGLGNPQISKFGAMNSALTRGLFDERLAKSISGLLTPYYELTGAKETIKALGTTFEGLIKTDVYASASTMAASMVKFSWPIGDYQAMQSAFAPLSQATGIVDTTWLRNSSSWLVEKNALSGLDVGKLSGMSSNFSRLCSLEYKTSLLANTPETLTSAVSQIASITTALDKKISAGWKYDNMLTISTLISDYCHLATRQHELIQKANGSDEISWRLGVIDAASKFVDRQVSWYLGFTDSIVDEENADSEDEIVETESTALLLIPTHIGYTRRVDKTPTEGLEDSTIVAITEKGKRIADNILMINKLRLDAGEDRIFGLSETVVGGMLNLSTAVCSTEEQLGRIIDVLYFVFYENLKHIKTLIGQGDENKGDEMVRKEDIYQCIFDVKTIRSDLRHDLNHGKPSEVKKKLKRVGDCYKEYCGNRPLKPKDFKRLQERIYDKVIELENALIQMLVLEAAE